MGKKGSGRRPGPGALRGGGRNLLWFLLALSAGGFSPGAARAQQQAPILDAIRFEGNEHLSDRSLRKVMRLRQPAWWRPFDRPRYLGSDFLAADLGAILRRYQDAGYPLAQIQEAVVSFDEKGERVSLEILVEEGPLIRLSETRLTGVESQWIPKIQRRFSLKPDDPLSLTRLDLDQVKLEEFYADEGHALVQSIREIRYRDGRALVVFRVDPGPTVTVDSIHLEGLERAKPQAVLREVTLKPGDLLTHKELLKSRQRVLGTGIFQRVSIVPEFADSMTPKVDLRIKVLEKKRGWVGAGAGYSSSDQLRFLTEAGLYNLTGLGRRISLRGDLYYSLDPDFRRGGVQFKEGIVRADYSTPRVLGTPTRGLLSLYHRWIQEAEFHSRILGSSATLTRELTLTSRASISLENRQVATTDTASLANYATTLVRLEWNDDARDNPFDPNRGHFIQGQFEYAGGLLGGTNEFGRLTAVWQAYSSTPEGWVAAGRIRAGYIQPFGRGASTAVDTLRVARVPWEERFRLGGSNTIRGYGEEKVGRRNSESGQPIGGLAMFLANAELRFPLFWIIKGGIFLDAGNVWNDPSEVKLTRFTKGFRERAFNPLNTFYGMGLGLRIATPVGPLRADYGFKVGSGRAPGEASGQLHVALGQAF